MSHLKITKILILLIYSVLLASMGHALDLQPYFLNQFTGLESKLYSKRLRESIIDRFSARSPAVQIQGQEWYFLNRFPNLDEIKENLNNKSFKLIINDMTFDISAPRDLGKITQLEMKNKELKVNINQPKLSHWRESKFSSQDFYIQDCSIEALFEIQFSDNSKQTINIAIETDITFPGLYPQSSNFIFKIAKLIENQNQLILLWNFNPEALKEQFRPNNNRISIKENLTPVKHSANTVSASSDFDVTKLLFYRSSVDEVDKDLESEPLCAYRIRPSSEANKYTLDLKGSGITYSYRLTPDELSSIHAFMARLIFAYDDCHKKEEQNISQKK